MADLAKPKGPAQGAGPEKTETVVGIIDKKEEAKVEEKKGITVEKNASIDVSVTVISLDGDKFHETGTEFQMGKGTAEKLAKLGRVKIKEEEKK